MLEEQGGKRQRSCIFTAKTRQEIPPTTEWHLETKQFSQINFQMPKNIRKHTGKGIKHCI